MNSRYLKFVFHQKSGRSGICIDYFPAFYIYEENSIGSVFKKISENLLALAQFCLCDFTFSDIGYREVAMHLLR